MDPSALTQLDGNKGASVLSFIRDLASLEVAVEITFLWPTYIAGVPAVRAAPTLAGRFGP